jgi:hypothetical protein
MYAIRPDQIDASVDTLMRQAPMTASVYMAACIAEIDERLGEGYARANPALLAAMVQASALDFHTACTCNGLARLTEAVEAGLGGIHEGVFITAVEAITDSMDGVAKSLDGIRKAIPR